jgi:hypothetical protein
LTLTTSPESIGSAEVQEICALQDAVYRNWWITFGYYSLSERLHEHIGNNASWCTFARWSSATVGENLDIDRDSRRLDDVFNSKAYLKPFVGMAQQVYRDARGVSDAAMPRTLAQGNHFVFAEIGTSVAKFLEWFEPLKDELADLDEPERLAAWNKYRPQITGFRNPDSDEIFRPADIAWLQDGLECYFRATTPGISKAARAQYVLRGNILLACYEQWRLDPVLRIALDPFAKSLVEFRSPKHDGAEGAPAPGNYPVAYLRRKGTRWALQHESAVRRWLIEKYGRMLTRHWMTLNIPIDDPHELTAIVLGRGVPDDKAATRRQRRLEDNDLTKLVVIYDYNPTEHTRGARNWCNFAERMQFIVELFLALQDNKNLYAPMRDDELAMLRIDIDEDNLNRLARISDKPADDYVRNHCDANAHDARTLVHSMVRRGLQVQLGNKRGAKSLQGQLPPWCQDAESEEKLRRGQLFFRENALEIATALFAASLPLTYTAKRGARVLTATAEMTSGNINRRVAETGRMLLDIMTVDDPEYPLTQGTAANDAARGVRLFHAAVRHMLWEKKSPEDRQTYFPINQEDLLGALVAFTVVVLDSLDKMGVSVSEKDQEAYVFLWVTLGYLLGIDYRQVHRKDQGVRSSDPLTLAQLRVIGTALWRRNARATPDGQTLTAALMHMFRDTLPGPMRDLPPAVTRILIGDESGDLLEVPRAGAPARLVLRAARPVTRLVSRGRLAGFLPGRVHSRTVTLYQNWINTHHGDRPPWEVPDDQLRERLRLRRPDTPIVDRRTKGTRRNSYATPASFISRGRGAR